MGSPRRPEHRGYSGRSRRQSRQAQPLGKDQPRLLVGAILHVLYAEKDKTLAGVASFLSDPRRPVEATLRAMMDTPHLGEAGVHPVIASSARELLNKSENERSGVLSTAMSFLGLYRDPVVARVTAAATGALPIWSEQKNPSASTSSCRRRTSTAPSR
jgi:type IV secretion system protein VirD4